ncbi:phage holin [Cohnella sp. GCM10012308]|uniref:phage holin n=1 Tax=Cohnella sp. GCM10012308 TaxID=3317329 RepID=UPI00360F03EE
MHNDWGAFMTALANHLLELIFAVLVAYAVSLRNRFTAWLNARTTAAQRETLHKLATEAAALAESMMGGGAGALKLDKAIKYVSDRAATLGIKVSEQSIRAAIEKAVLDYKAQIKGGTAVAKTEQ